MKKYKYIGKIFAFTVLITALALMVCAAVRFSFDFDDDKNDVSIAADNKTTGGDYEIKTEADTEDSSNIEEIENESVKNEAKTIEDEALEIFSSMTLREQICQMFIVKPEQLTGVSIQTQAGTETKQALENYCVGGIVYFADNIQTPEQITEMIDKSQSYSKIGLFIAVDEEGGSVARIANNSNMGTTVFPDMKTIGASGDTDNAYNVGYTIGTEISKLGFNLDFAPVADVDSNPDNTVIGNRSFSSNPVIAANMVSAAVKGFNDSGILCTLKHFPGHGDTVTDSHEGYTAINKSLDELWEVELVPFQSGVEAGADFVMVGHISVPKVTGDNTPSSLSGTMIDILKNDLNFDGLIITDSMQMKAITDYYSSGQASAMAVEAGADVILMPENLEEAVDGILEAVSNGKITEERIEESVLKIIETKIRMGIIVAE